MRESVTMRAHARQGDPSLTFDWQKLKLLLVRRLRVTACRPFLIASQDQSAPRCIFVVKTFPHPAQESFQTNKKAAENFTRKAFALRDGQTEPIRVHLSSVCSESNSAHRSRCLHHHQKMQPRSFAKCSVAAQHKAIR